MSNRPGRAPRIASILIILTLFVSSSAAPATLADDDAPMRHGTVGIFGDRDPRVLYSIDTDAKVVALTIDDAPDPETTHEILQVLGENSARATFFVITGRMGGQEELLREIVDAGHELGNHLTHDAPSIELAPDDFEQHLRSSKAALAPFGGARFFRPGSGYYDDAMLDIVEAEGLRCALGWVYPFDAQIPFSWTSKLWIRWGTRPGSIIILHDGGKRGRRTAQTLRAVLPVLRERGFSVVTLSELVALDGGASAYPAP